MRNKNFTTIIIILATVILAGVAIFTAIKLYQTRQGTVAPTAPTSKPAAATPAPATSCQQLAFTLTVTSSSPTPTPTPTATATATATPTPLPQCGTSCTTNSDCPSSMVCYVGACRNASCTTATNCVCTTATPTPTPTLSVLATPTPTLVALASPTPAPSLPVSGDVSPTILGITGGAILLVLGLALIL